MKKKVMVVDDSRILQMQLGKILEDTDYEMAAYCQSGEEAVEKYREIRPDVVTMDIIMPGMDGLEAARTILQEYPDARIVMVSSLAYDDTLEEASEIGAKSFIGKPFEKEQVMEALEEALAGD